jgi:predicted transposase YdaD
MFDEHGQEKLQDEKFAEGIAEGERRGQRSKALETARNLLGMGLSTEQIEQATGLPIEDRALADDIDLRFAVDKL